MSSNHDDSFVDPNLAAGNTSDDDGSSRGYSYNEGYQSDDSSSSSDNDNEESDGRQENNILSEPKSNGRRKTPKRCNRYFSFIMQIY